MAPHLSTLLPYLKGHSGLDPRQAATLGLKLTQMIAAAAVVEGVSLGVTTVAEVSRLRILSLCHP